MEFVQLALAAPLTGVFDESTEQRVKGIQQMFKLPITGVVDQRTAEKIDWLVRTDG